MNRILVNCMDGIAIEKLWNNPECIRKAEIINSQLFLYCNEKIPIFAARINHSDTPVKGVKFMGETIQITL